MKKIGKFKRLKRIKLILALVHIAFSFLFILGTASFLIMLGNGKEDVKYESGVKTPIPDNLHGGRREQNMERRKFRQERKWGDSLAESKRIHMEQEKQYKNGEEGVRNKETAAVKDTRKNDEENREV